MIITRDFDHEDLDHYTKPRALHKTVVILLITGVPIVCFLILLLLRKQIGNLWVRIRKWSVGMPQPQNAKDIDDITDLDMAKATGTGERGVVLPFQT
ncbi:hypothetical protein ABW19_dt0208347 [Dactylella cylindrospora]|nr:hypothetical protein ABW19_dt0208347 [Dactylella cylindrospora]